MNYSRINQFRFCQYLLTLTLAITAQASCAALVTNSLDGTFTNWFNNPLIAEDAEISLNATYDESWIKNVVSAYSGPMKIINIIDYYDQGARLSLSIGNDIFHEVSSENPELSADVGWSNSIPYLIFDANNNPIGLGTHWVRWWCTNSSCSPLYQVTGGLVSGEGALSISLNTGGTLNAALSPHVVPAPSALWLFGSAMLGLAQIKRRQCRPSKIK